MNDDKAVQEVAEKEWDELREMLKAIKVWSCDYDPETEKHETTTYQFEEVWHMGEAREKHRHARTAKELAETKAALSTLKGE
jgi:hypothetical protein